MFSISTLALNPLHPSPNIAKISNSFCDYCFIQTLLQQVKIVIAESLNKFGSPDFLGECIESNFLRVCFLPCMCKSPFGMSNTIGQFTIHWFLSKLTIRFEIQLRVKGYVGLHYTQTKVWV
jgi:hypothetical protein